MSPLHAVGLLYGVIGWAERPTRLHLRSAGAWMMTAALAFGVVLMGVGLEGHMVPDLLIGLAIGVFAAGAIVIVLTWVDWHHKAAHPIRRDVDVDTSTDMATERRLRERCAELARRINEDIGDYRRATNALSYEHFKRLPAATHQQDHVQFWQDAADTSTLSEQLMDRYRRIYKGEALALFDQAKQRGWSSPSVDRFRLEHPTNPLGIEAVATQLATWGVTP